LIYPYYLQDIAVTQNDVLDTILSCDLLCKLPMGILCTKYKKLKIAIIIDIIQNNEIRNKGIRLFSVIY